MNIDVLNDNIMVKELYDDFKVNEVLNAYDEDAPYMICEIVGISEEAKEKLELDTEDILVIKRYAKEEFVSGLYFISWKDVRAKISKEKYKDILDKGIIF